MGVVPPPSRSGTELFKSAPLQYNSLRTTFPDRLIYRGDYTTWPSCSPDLTLYDFCLGYLKADVFECTVETCWS